MHIMEKSKKLANRLDRYNDRFYERKRKRLTEKLDVAERVYVLAERIKKKSAPGKFYKETVQNISYFNKETVYIVRKRKEIDNINYYCIKSPLSDLKKQF